MLTLMLPMSVQDARFHKTMSCTIVPPFLPKPAFSFRYHFFSESLTTLHSPPRYQATNKDDTSHHTLLCSQSLNRRDPPS